MELKSKTFKELRQCSWWVQIARECINGDRNKNILIELDEIAYLAEKDCNSKILSDRIKFLKNDRGGNYQDKSGKTLSDAKTEREAQLFEFFTELKVYKELLDSGYISLEFLPEKSTKQPDIKAKLNNKVVFVEVKSMRKPKDEAEALKKCRFPDNIADKIKITPEFRESIKNKIDCFIKNALLKFKSVDMLKKAKNILVINYEEGFNAWVFAKNRSGINLIEILEQNYFDDLMKRHKITIWPKKYF